jgi:hypothetical protein
MARPLAILRALALAYRRDWTAFQSLAGNNFFLITVFLLRQAGAFVYLIIGLVLLFPLSTDPLRKIPASRLALWPLERRERWLLRAVSPWINPLTWVIAALAVWTARRNVTLGLWALVAGLFAAGFALSSLPAGTSQGMWRRVPEFRGPLNQRRSSSPARCFCYRRLAPGPPPSGGTAASWRAAIPGSWDRGEVGTLLQIAF